MQRRKIVDAELLKMINEDGKSKPEAAKYFGVSLQAVIKRLKKLNQYGLPESVRKLTDKRKKFVVGIVQDGKSQTQAAFDAFDVKDRESAKVIGCNLMREEDIQEAVEDLKMSNGEVMQQVGITRLRVFKKLGIIINDRDPNTSLRAIETTSKIAGWNSPELLVVKHDFEYDAYIQSIEKDMEEEERTIQRLETALGPDSPEIKKMRFEQKAFAERYNKTLTKQKYDETKALETVKTGENEFEAKAE
jgi:predicted transcriptional regulator